ncbi:serine/threonine-protein kinase STY46 [Lactuca sativa]|uniref:serine/threonine-protein kinase STY46 n=1 Tax=Lactuca sativa TaxID=4236 RepID=UPI000CD9163D|nr:serine/threonine-protein kinase STY46 [Lactuca sativa]
MVASCGVPVLAESTGEGTFSKQFGLNIHVSFYKYVDEAAYEHIKASVETNLKQYKLMVADFGVAWFLSQGGLMTVINHQQYDEKADVFSFVIVLWELVTAKVLYEKMRPL